MAADHREDEGEEKANGKVNICRIVHDLIEFVLGSGKGKKRSSPLQSIMDVPVSYANVMRWRFSNCECYFFSFSLSSSFSRLRLIKRMTKKKGNRCALLVSKDMKEKHGHQTNRKSKINTFLDYFSLSLFLSATRTFSSISSGILGTHIHTHWKTDRLYPLSNEGQISLWLIPID